MLAVARDETGLLSGSSHSFSLPFFSGSFSPESGLSKSVENVQKGCFVIVAEVDVSFWTFSTLDYPLSSIMNSRTKPYFIRVLPDRN
jgi:hypothetical protein